MSVELTPDFSVQLLAAPDYRTFLQEYCELTPLSFAALARRSGFASRAYVREVIEGKRRLTVLSVGKFSTGLHLRGDWKPYFRLLVARTEKDSCPEGWSSARIERQLEILRAKIEGKRSRRAVKNDPDLVDSYLKVPYFLEIYAASGEIGSGSSLNEIQLRTGLDSRVLKSSLSKMEKLGVFVRDQAKERFLPTDFHIAISAAERSEYFRRAYVKGLELARKGATHDLGSPEKLFFQSTFCVRVNDLPILKQRLRKLLDEFVESSIDGSGERVVNLITALS